MSIKVSVLSPCVTFFSAGRPGAGSLSLLMQMTILLWPFAFAWARHYKRAAGVKQVLTDFSVTYTVPCSAHVRPRKRFRRADLSEVFPDDVSFGHLKARKVRAA
jgi:hypothetical protein